MAEETILIEAILAIKTIIGRPILLRAILVAQQAGDRMPAEGKKMREQMPPSASKGLGRRETVGTLGDQLFGLLEESRVFFRSMGLGGTSSRERIR